MPCLNITPAGPPPSLSMLDTQDSCCPLPRDEKLAAGSGEGAPGAAAHAVGLAGFVAAGPGHAPEDAPGPAGGQQPVGLAAEGAEELLLQALAAEIRGTREIGAEGLDEVLGHDAAYPDGQEERGRRRTRRQIEEPRVLAAVHVGEPPTEIPRHGI